MFYDFITKYTEIFVEQPGPGWLKQTAIFIFIFFILVAKTEKTGIHEHNQSWLPGFLRAAGEEIGWRSFLLPCLMTVFDPTMSILLR